ncbi:MAG TPA: hypothetical protein VLS90_03815 [Thermodesulfobacteriota bacterium]|nr:hypothetical protein [Thermodesulfobacteriota bacterium]
MRKESETKVKFGVAGVVIGALVVITIGFAWAGWVTQGTAQKMSDEAVLASQAAICVAQFMKQPNHKENLVELGKMDAWKRPEFVEKGGWDRMPGQEKAGSYVSQACAKGLDVLAIK